ncbi:hypothetical protein L6452_28278 [Arctium lappa]|uniref:Uncharacterized protein n=1 Tax=Arctium lappa TaxID=4217 RepID=A0ACB8ZY13_ARCLA|nr:hypothetical protein L6452_28278 [Arctium lappa]
MCEISCGKHGLVSNLVNTSFLFFKVGMRFKRLGLTPRSDADGSRLTARANGARRDAHGEMPFSKSLLVRS